MRKKNDYRYITKSERFAHLAPSTYKRDDRKAKFWLQRDNDVLWFINDSDDVLDYVVSSTGGCISYDDGVLSVENPDYRYEKVEQGEAVKIHEYDSYYDLDYLLQAGVTIVSGNEEINLLGRAKKGGIRGQEVLMFDENKIMKKLVVQRGSY